MDESIYICRDFINWLKSQGKSRGDAISILKKSQAIPISGGKLSIDQLTSDWKNLIISYTYPRYIGNYQLPTFIQMYRSKLTTVPTQMTPDVNETGIILESYKGRIYENFIRHLIWGFCKNEQGMDDNSKIIRIQPDPSIYSGCPICGEKHPEQPHFGSTESSVTICNRCLPNLILASHVLDLFEPNFIMKYR